MAKTSSAQNRLGLISNQLKNHTPKLNTLKQNGWVSFTQGYRDTQLFLNSNKQVELTGNRYLYSGKVLSSFAKWAQQNVGIEFTQASPSQTAIPVNPPVRNSAFNEQAANHCVILTQDDNERSYHSHGHSLQQMFILKFGRFQRTVDLVVYPGCLQHVEQLVKLANTLNVVLIPFGGGTNVTQALLLDGSEERTICSVDMSKMDHVREVNLSSMTALVEAGITGKDLELELSRYGVCCGHQPDSVEFSTLGGWISTRASGMKKNVYGNIDDIVLTVKIVTSIGTWEKPCQAPRISTGPDVNQMILGHEGLFGIITQALIKVKPLPPAKAYGSYVFPTYQHGIKFMKDLGMNGIRPASVRLMDNVQFHFASALKPTEHSNYKHTIDSIKKYYVTKIKKFKQKEISACTLVYQGSKEVVKLQKKQVDTYAKKYKALKGGAENGIRGYFLTFMIAYIRDLGMQYHLVAESFQASVPYQRLEELISKLPGKVEAACQARGVAKKPLVSTRITQLYDTGACIYVYFGFVYKGISDPVKAYTEIEHEARQEILNCGGSLSHHHGVGKIRKGFVGQAIGEPGLEFIRALKNRVDPKNIFATNNLITV